MLIRFVPRTKPKLGLRIKPWYYADLFRYFLSRDPVKDRLLMPFWQSARLKLSQQRVCTPVLLQFRQFHLTVPLGRINCL